MKDNMIIYVGTYHHLDGLSENSKFSNIEHGIHIVKLDREKKCITYENTVTGVDNPSFLTVDSQNHHLYSVNETHEYQGEAAGSISAFSIDSSSGALTLLNRKSTGGQHPCHVKLSQDDKFVIVSNYSSGSVSVYEVGKEGLGNRTAFIQHEGNSINRDRQNGPHAHSCQIVQDMPYAIIMDLGLDKLMVYRLKEDGSLLLCPELIYYCEGGSGPRHCEVHPHLNCIYVINELSSDITVIRYDKVKFGFEHIQTIPTISNECDNTGADIHITKDGRFLYASNRGEDSIAIYAVDPTEGTLTFIKSVSCGGKTPRNFAIDPLNQFLFVANQDSNDIVMYEIQQENGLLAEVYRLEIPKPVCICPICM